MISIERKETKCRNTLRQAVESLESRVLLAYTLDPSFSGDGIAQGAGTNMFVVQPDNKIVALVPDTKAPGLARFLTDGSLDPTFGSGGKVALPFEPVDMAFSGGKILVAGGGIARYNLNGTLDTTFGGGDGIAEVPTEHSTTLNDMAVAPDGKLVVVGAGFEMVDISQPSEDRAYDVSARFNPDGTLDKSYAGDGVSEELVPDVHHGGMFNTGVQSDGKIILVSMSSFGPMDGATWTMARTANADGTADTFEAQGWSNGDIPRDLEIQSDNKILLIRDDRLVRYTANGPVDTTFNPNGLGNSNISGVQPLSNGNILVAGFDAGGRFVARLLANGNPDTTFAPGGKVMLGSFAAADVRPDSLNRVIAGGSIAEPSGIEAAVARLADSSQAPFKGSPFNIGDTIQAEDFDKGGEGVAYHDKDAGNNGGAYRLAEGVDIQATTDTGGGYNVGWTNPGEWMDYTINIPTAGTYTIDTRLASPRTGSTFHYEIDGVNVSGNITIPNTGTYQTWRTVTSSLGSLSAGTHVLRLVINSGTNDGAVNFNWFKINSGSGGTGTGTGLKGEYFNNMDFTAPAFTRNDANIDFNWGTGSPDSRVQPDTFSVRWTGQIQVATSGRYTFYTTTDDGARLTVNGQRLIDKLAPQAATEWSGSIDLVAGQKYDISMEYFERFGGALAKLMWSGPGIAKQVVPASAFSGGGGTSDTEPPTAAVDFHVRTLDDTSIQVAWDAAGDNVAVAGYELHLDNGNWFSVGPDMRGWTFINLQPNSTHTMFIRAFDAAGNRGPIGSVTATTTGGSGGSGLSGTYFDNMDFTNPRFSRFDPTINFNWGTGSPDSRLGADTFSVRWTGRLTVPTSGRYTFFTTSDDGARLTINGQKVIDHLTPQATTEWSGSIDLNAGQEYPIILDYIERFGGANIKFEWSGPEIGRQVVPASVLTGDPILL